MVGRAELREIRQAGGGRKLAQDFYRPRRRVRPGMKHRKPLQDGQLELLFPDEAQLLTTPRDPARPLADVFAEFQQPTDSVVEKLDYGILLTLSCFAPGAGAKP
jgi:hypothetical protein